MNVHETIPVQVWADVDVGIAEVVRQLNTIPGVRTHTSCQGTIGGGGPAPYEAFVHVSWSNPAARAALEKCNLTVEGEAHGTVRPFVMTADEEALRREYEGLLAVSPRMAKAILDVKALRAARAASNENAAFVELRLECLARSVTLATEAIAHLAALVAGRSVPPVG
jgi:hypothetical protein